MYCTVRRLLSTRAGQEMLLIYAHDHQIYRRLVYVHYFVFTSGCALCSPLAYGMYGAAGFASAFYVSAILAAVVGAFIALVYNFRLARTPGGVLGSLATAEAYIKEQYAPASESGHNCGTCGQAQDKVGVRVI